MSYVCDRSSEVLSMHFHGSCSFIQQCGAIGTFWGMTVGGESRGVCIHTWG